MSRSNNSNMSMKAAIRKLMESYRLADRLDRLEIMDVWEELMGQMIARKTGDIQFKEGVLRVELTSAPLRNELEMGKEKIIEMINQRLERRLVREIRFF